LKSFLVLLEDQLKANASLPVRKKAKNERGTIMSFFNNKKTEHKENNSRHRSNSSKQSTKIITRQNKKKEQEQQSIPTNHHLISSVHVEKTSLILFDEVLYSEKIQLLDNFSFPID
jgi:hypothetical protein